MMLSLSKTFLFELLGTHVAALDKVVYLQNRRFLPVRHPLRKGKKYFPSGNAEHRLAPNKLTQEEVMINNVAYEKAKNRRAGVHSKSAILSLHICSDI